MKRVIPWACGLALAVLVWTAVHDLAIGESDVAAETSTLLFVALLLVCLALGRFLRARGSRD